MKNNCINKQEEHKQKLPYWFETKEWKEFSKLADTHFGGNSKYLKTNKI